jgi:hypothetical protein
MRRRIGLLFALGSVAGVALAAPSGTFGATTLGETFVPSQTCAPGDTFVQSTSPGGKYAAPAAGVITRWSFQADSTPTTDKLKFKVARATDIADEFTVIGESPLVDPVTNTLNSYPVQIPVQAGDVIGVYWDQGNAALSECVRDDTAYKDHYFVGDVLPGTTQAFTPEEGYQFDVSALLEPDCDKDGLGDETQDADTAACHPAAVAQPVVKKKKCKKKKHKRSAESAKKKKCKKKKRK